PVGDPLHGVGVLIGQVDEPGPIDVSDGDVGAGDVDHPGERGLCGGGEEYSEREAGELRLHPVYLPVLRTWILTASCVNWRLASPPRTAKSGDFSTAAVPMSCHWSRPRLLPGVRDAEPAHVA